MTNEMPERIWICPSGKPVYSVEDDKDTTPELQYTRTNLCVPQDVLRQVADALEGFGDQDTLGGIERRAKAISSLKPYLKEKL